MTSTFQARRVSDEDHRAFRFDLFNTYDEIVRFSEWLNGLLPHYGFSKQLVFRADLVLTEALTNIVDHALASEKKEGIVVNLTLERPLLDVEIVDGGRPFNPLDDHHVVVPESLERAGNGGLGIHLIQSYAAKAAYLRRDGRNFLTLQLEDEADGDYERFIQHGLVRSMTGAPLEDVFKKCAVFTLEAGDILLSPGEENHFLYLLLTGKLLVFIDTVGSESSFTIEAGEYTGEMSIIDEKAPSAFVVAETACRVLQMHEDIFWQEIASRRSVMRNMLHMFSQRMRKQISMTVSTLEQQLRYEHLQKELEAAGKIQANLLPQQTPLFPDVPQVDVYATMTPAREVGGDFFDAFPVDETHICVAVGDVAGKGLPSALFMVRVMTLMRMSMLKRKNFRAIVPKVNELLIESNPECNFVTLFLGMLNVENGRFQYFNGGHNAPFISRSGQRFKPLDMPKGALLGVSERVQFEMAETQLEPGDTVLLYTDGITEAENEHGDFFTTQKVKRILEKMDSDTPVKTLVTRLQQEVFTFCKNVPQTDDITLMALRYLG